MNERRRFLRVKRTFPFVFNLRRKNEKLDSKTYDISEGGIGFHSPIKLKKEDIIYLRIAIPGYSEQMVIRGIVRWTTKTKEGELFVGVEFFNIDQEERDIILKALRQG